MERSIPEYQRGGLGLILCALAVLILPFRWILGLTIAILCHEGGHLLALYLLDIPVMEIRGSLTGIRILTYELSPIQEFIAASAGPLFSFLLVTLKNVFPEVAVCAMVQGFYNLMPIYPSDGGRILSAILYKLEPERKDRILCLTGLLFLIFIAAAAVFVFRGSSLGVFIVCAFAFWTRFRNIPCKETPKEVK